jgi:ABC-type transport system substrate-binding protein
MRSRLILLSLVLLVFSVLPISESAARQPLAEGRYGGTLRVRSFVGGAFRPHFDPAGDAHDFLLEQVYDGLVRLDKDLNVIPVLAEYWVISEQGKKFTFFLRRGVRFHHGRELEAGDVKSSLERLIRKETDTTHYQYFVGKVEGAQEYREGKASHVEGLRVVDKYTFEIVWTHPYVSALYLLSANFCKVLPGDLLASQGKGLFQKPSGTGPFKFAHWLRSPRLDIVGARLERNADYFGKRPFLDAVEFSPYYTLDHFLDREIDIIPYISSRLANTDCQVLENESFSPAYLAMSCHLPPLDNPAVRRAVAMAVDKKEIAKAAFRLDTIPQVTNNFIPARLPGFFPADDRGGPDIEAAIELLSRNGYPGEKDFPAFSLYFEGPRSDEADKIYHVMRDALAGLGIRLRMKSYRSVEDLRKAREPYLVFLNWRMDFPAPENIIFPLFLSASVPNKNLMHYANPRLDELAGLAETERSWTERIALFQKIERMLDLDVPAIPLFSGQERLALQPYVRGVRIPPLGSFYLDAKEIWLDR